jgi:endogenous inhibitor of DNA gyrase (YacG/DUF329 family)
MVKCKICKKEFESYASLGCHLKKHKITAKEYYDKYLKKDKNEGICPVCGKETNFYSINKGYAKFCSKRCANKGENNFMYGKHHSEESKKKMSDVKKGKHPSEETRKKLSDAQKGKHHSEETNKKISDANKGKNNPNYRKHHSEKTKKKISESNKGERNPFYGKHHTEETKKKLSDANKSENHPNYKGGISLKEFKDAYGLEPEKWKKIAQQIRIRDKFICQCCGKKGATDVHHIIPRRIKIDNDPDNLITLCRSCHRKIEHLTDIYLAEDRDPREISFR